MNIYDFPVPSLAVTESSLYVPIVGVDKRVVPTRDGSVPARFLIVGPVTQGPNGAPVAPLAVFDGTGYTPPIAMANRLIAENGWAFG